MRGIAFAAAFALVGCSKPSREAESSDIRALCSEPQGSDSRAVLANTYPAAAGFEELSDRLTTSRWRKWLAETDKHLSQRTKNESAARESVAELEAAGASAGLSSCWAASRVRHAIEGQ